jgi:sulfite reductase (ferredoxin)
LVPGPGGALVEGFQIHLGGGLALAAGQNSGFGRKLRGLKTTAEQLPEYVERIARRYLAGRGEGEPFAQWVLRAEEAELL